MLQKLVDVPSMIVVTAQYDGGLDQIGHQNWAMVASF